MFSPERDEYTICAMTTPPGRGGTSVVRISGPGAIDKARRICWFLPLEWDSHRAYYGLIKSAKTNEPVDEVLATVFAEGRSFTGEETVEISCHGSPIIVENIIQELIECGCHAALAGEFTYRAFMNGRIDLVQAESVLGLIESDTRQAARMALRQLRGDFSQRLQRIQDDLTWIGAQLEAAIDFSAEDIVVVSPEGLSTRLENCRSFLEELIGSYRVGRVLHEGVAVALVGRPNVGKSSLLNRIIGEERAIVTAVPGTTRDVVEGQILLGGTKFSVFDTAGLRETSDEVESIGIEKTHRTVEEADVVLFVVDGSVDLAAEELSLLHDLPDKPRALLVNKMDLSIASAEELASQYRVADPASEGEKGGPTLLLVSAKTGDGMEALLNFLRTFGEVTVPEHGSVVTQARHYEGLVEILSCVIRAQEMLLSGASPEFPAFEVMSALKRLYEILGTEFDDQVMDRVFREFCIGK